MGTCICGVYMHVRTDILTSFQGTLPALPLFLASMFASNTVCFQYCERLLHHDWVC